MKLSKLGAFIAVIVIVLGGAFLASALGLFAFESEKEAALIKTGDFAGLADPNDIRGSYSFADIETNFGVSPELLAKAFGIEGTAVEIAEYQCKGLEEKYLDAPEEIGTSSVRLFVAFLLGMPVELGPFLPESAVEVLLQNGVPLTPEREQYLKEHSLVIEESISLELDANKEAADSANQTVNQTAKKLAEEQPKEATVAAVAPAKTNVTAALNEKETVVTPVVSKEAQAAVPSLKEPVQTPSTAIEAIEPAGALVEEVPVAEAPAVAVPEEHVSTKEVGTVKGSTTIYDMMSWGVKREDIGPAVGIELPSDNGAKLKDLITEAGKSFDELKIVLQKLVDEAK